MNIVILDGHVGDEPDIHIFDNDDKQATVSLATTKKWKDRATGEKKSKTQWHRLIMGKGLADVVETYVQKGHKLTVKGELRYRKYDGENGTVYITEIYVSDMTMQGSPVGSGEHPNEQKEGDGKADKKPAAKKEPAAKKAAPKKQAAPAIGEDDLPF